MLFISYIFSFFQYLVVEAQCTTYQKMSNIIVNMGCT